ncbi:MAG: glycosyltransferase family 39 protein [Anaerolineales bacterium]|nr:glycosyltransferase family 39 protein [Anaerolineales bacterium]
MKSELASISPLQAPQFAWRGLATILLIGGLLLVILGQSAYTAVPKPLSYMVTSLALIGVVAFLLGGRIAVKQQIPDWLQRPTSWLAGYFAVMPGQILLFFFAICFSLLAWLTAGHGLKAFHATVSFFSWVLALGCVVVGSLIFSEEKVHISIKVLLATAVLFAIALFLRGVATAQIPTTFSGDEGSAGLFAVSMLRGEANNLLGLGWFSFPAFYFGIQSLSIALFGQSIEALRLTSALAGALTVVAVYWLGRVLFGRLTGVLAAIYLAVSHYHIHMSRIGLNNVWDSLFGTVALLGLWDGWQNGRRLSFVLCGLALGLGQYFYASMRLLPVMFLIWAFAALIADRERFKVRLPGFILAAFVALIVFLPLGLLFAQHPNEFNAPLQRVSILGDRLQQEMIVNGRTATGVLIDQAAKTALGFTSEPLRLLYDPGVPLLLSLAAALFLIGLLWLIFQFDLRTLLLIMPLLGVVFTGSFSQMPPASQRYILVMPIVAILVALPLAQLSQWLQTMWPAYRRVTNLVVALLLLWLVVTDLNFYFQEVYANGYVLGGHNTVTAHGIATYLQAQKPPDQQIYFFGFPRMGYFSLSTIPYLVPQMRAEDIAEPLAAPPTWPLSGSTIFVFLPERVSEMAYVQAAYPDGAVQEIRSSNDQPLFFVYQVEP